MAPKKAAKDTKKLTTSWWDQSWDSWDSWDGGEHNDGGFAALSTASCGDPPLPAGFDPHADGDAEEAAAADDEEEAAATASGGAPPATAASSTRVSFVLPVCMGGSGRTADRFNISVHATDTVANVKGQIWQLKGVPTHCQRMVFHRETLDDARTLLECDLDGSDVLQVVVT
jgi:hypothetical protein